jgi:hypothetical protein
MEFQESSQEEENYEKIFRNIGDSCEEGIKEWFSNS